MSFLTLLATGKSLIGVRDGISPYRMCTKNLLPNFGITKNPFAPQAKTAILPTAASIEMPVMQTLPLFAAQPKPLAQEVKHEAAPLRVKIAAPAMESIESSPKPVAPAEIKPVVGEIPNLASASSVRAVEKNNSTDQCLPRKGPARVARDGNLLGDWLGKLNPVAHLSAWSKAGAKRSNRLRVPEQAELLLAKVKPLRNELTDSDVEIVPARGSVVEMKSEPKAVENLHGVTGPWNRLTSKIFGAEHVQAK